MSKFGTWKSACAPEPIEWTYLASRPARLLCTTHWGVIQAELTEIIEKLVEDIHSGMEEQHGLSQHWDSTTGFYQQRVCGGPLCRLTAAESLMIEDL